MKLIKLQEPLVLTIFLNTRGLNFALFESILAPVDYGIKVLRSKTSSECLNKASALIKRWKPSVIVLQDCECKLSKCTERVKRLINQISALAKRERIQVCLYSRKDIRDCFARYDARNKDEIARAIAKQLPEFEPQVPPMRNLWSSEHHRMGLFDALALMFTYYANEWLLGG